MQHLLGKNVRSIILTSGTLAPLKPLIAELGIPISVRLENPHIIKASQICVKVVPMGPDKEPLISNYENRYDAMLFKLASFHYKHIFRFSETIQSTSCHWAGQFCPFARSFRMVYSFSSHRIRCCTNAGTHGRPAVFGHKFNDTNRYTLNRKPKTNL